MTLIPGTKPVDKLSIFVSRETFHLHISSYVAIVIIVLVRDIIHDTAKIGNDYMQPQSLIHQ